MGQSYQVYFNIKSENKFRSIHESNEASDLSEVILLLNDIQSNEDCVSIYLNTEKLRVQIWGQKDNSKCILELHDARKGVCFSREFDKSALKKRIELDMKEYVKNPRKYGFEAVSF